MGKAMAWIRRKLQRKPRKTPEQKARDNVMKHCQETRTVKIGVGEKAFSSHWYAKSKLLVLNNPWAANYIAGTLQNAKKRGLAGVVGMVNGKLAFIKTEDAIKEIQAMGRGQLYLHEQRFD